MLFPGAMLTFGTCGSYAGLTDLWIEGIRCQFVLDLVPADVSEAGVITRPAQIHLLLCGVGDGKGGGVGASGFSVRMLAEGFNLKGDKAPSLPVDLSTMKVTAILQVRRLPSALINSHRGLSPSCIWILGAPAGRQ